MFKKKGFKMLVAGVILAIPLTFGVASNAYAGGAGPEPGDIMLMPGKIVGVLTGTLGEPVPPATQYTLNNITFIGSFYKISGTTPVAIDPVATINIPAANTDEFLATTEEDMENWILANAGPPGVFSPAGGETLIITRVNEVYTAQAPGETYILGAKVTVRAIR